MRHRTIALPLAVLASLVLASVAVAGGWAQVTATNVPVDPPAGEETTIELAVSQHGETPVSWPDLTVIATNAASGETVRVAARAEGSVGSYVATIVFPSAGSWTLTFDSTDLEMAGWAKLQVATSAAAAPGAAGAPSQATTPGVLSTDVMAVVLVLFVLAVGLGIVTLGTRRRGAAPDAQAPAGT